MAITEAFLKRSRDLWVKREKDYKAKAAHAHERHKYRAQQLAARAKPKVVLPLKRITTDTWGWHPPVHDGVDLICPAREPALAVCRSTVVRVSASGWWGKGAPSDPVLKAKGDGVIVLRSLVDVGPIRKGMNFVYGHAENAVVKVGQVVEAGEKVGEAGFANAWHLHWCVNRRADTLGVGEQDPEPILNYLKENS